MPKRTGRPWQRRKARIIRRDGGICHLCGQPGADSADHLVPWSVREDNSDDNLAAVHHDVEPKCNRKRGNRPIEQARAELGPPPGWQW